jgi:hypothetical protein
MSLHPTWETVQEAINQPLRLVLVNALLLHSHHKESRHIITTCDHCIRDATLLLLALAASVVAHMHGAYCQPYIKVPAVAEA